MDEGLKQRLVGAAVLIALAVIFVPMMLKGGRDEQRVVAIDSGVPVETVKLPRAAAPVSEVEVSEPVVKTPPVATEPVATEPVATESATRESVTPDGGDAADGVATVEPPRVSDTPAPNLRPAETPSALRVRPPPVVEADSLATPAPGRDGASQPAVNVPADNQPPLTPSLQADVQQPQDGVRSSAATGWVVQVGSFSQPKNAVALRDKLRARGFSVFLRSVQAAENNMTRVLIGPLSKREAALAAAQTLNNTVQLDGVVRRYDGD